MNGHARVQAGRSHLVRAERAACASDMKVKSNSWQHGALVLARGTVDACPTRCFATRQRVYAAVSRAPPGPPPRGEPRLQLRPGVRAGGKRGRFFLSRIFLKNSLGSL